MTGLFLPGAVWRPVSYRGDAGPFTAPPIGYIVHVVVGNGSPYSTFENAPPGDRRFSTAWVAKNGSSEQFQTLDMLSWAQAAGNPFYWSFETEGYPSEPLTDAQINTIAGWHNFLGAPDVLAEAPGQPGSGTHYMGKLAYGGHTCPGPGPRAAQRQTIIDRARQLRTNQKEIPDMTPEQATILGTTGWGVQTLRTAEAMHFTALSVQVTALTAAVAALASHADLSADQITTIINDAIAAQVKVTGTLTVTPAK